MRSTQGSSRGSEDGSAPARERPRRLRRRRGPPFLTIALLAVVAVAAGVVFVKVGGRKSPHRKRPPERTRASQPESRLPGEGSAREAAQAVAPESRPRAEVSEGAEDPTAGEEAAREETARKTEGDLSRAVATSEGPVDAEVIAPQEEAAPAPAPEAGRTEQEAGPGFDPTAVRETSAHEVTDPAKQWAAEIEETVALIRNAVAEGAAAGKREPIRIEFGGRPQSARVVSADEDRLVVSLPGVEVPLQWERIGPRTIYGIGRKYLPPEVAGTHLRLGRYCLAHGFTDEAEKEFMEAMRLDRATISDVRPALEFIRRQEIERAVATVAGALKRSGPAAAGRSRRRARSGAPKRAGPKPGWEHPYIGFSRKDVPVLKARFRTQPFSAKWSRLLSNANGYLAGRPTSGSGGTASSRNSLGIAGSTAFAYAITGDGKFAERAKKEAFALISAKRWMHGKHAGFTRGADLLTAEASMACALVYDWCYTAMSDEERERLRDGMLRLGVEPYLKSVDTGDWWVNNLVTNWCGVCHGGCGLAALALYGESPKAKRATEEAFEYLQKFLRSAILEDGGGHEGVMYWRYGVEFGHYFFTAAERMFGIDGGLFADGAGKLAGYWDTYMQGPDMRYANFNDMGEQTFAGLSGGRSEGGPSGSLNALFESKVPGGDQLLLWAADNGGVSFRWQGGSPFYLLWRRPGAPSMAGSGKKPALQDAVLFRGAGHVIWKSPRLWFAYNGGWITDRSHFNCDLGSFVLVVGNERLVNDPGYGRHKTAEHSTVLVNGSGQRIGSRATYLRYGSGNGFRYLASDMTECYGQGLKKFVRHAIMVGGRYIVLVDDLAASRPVEFEWRLQTRSRIEIRPDGKGALVRGSRENLYVGLAAPRGALLSKGRAAIPFLRIKPGAESAMTIIATVLYPLKNAGVAPSVTLEARGASGAVLKVTHPNGRTDELVFGDARGYLMLASVNKQSAAKIGPPLERILKPFRRGQ